MKSGSRRSAKFVALGRHYVRRTLARSLDGVRVAGLDAARAVAQRQPIILAANHVGWWDSFLVIAIDAALGTEGHALMDAASIRRMPYFAWQGAVPLDQSAPRAGLRAGASLLGHAGQALWIFPSGAHRPAHLRPLGFKPGIEILVRLAPGAAVLPVAIEYAWAEAEKPGAWIHLGQPIPGSGTEQAVERGLARIDAALDGDTRDFELLIPPRGRRRDQSLGARVLAGARD